MFWPTETRGHYDDDDAEKGEGEIRGAGLFSVGMPENGMNKVFIGPLKKALIGN